MARLAEGGSAAGLDLGLRAFGFPRPMRPSALCSKAAAAGQLRKPRVLPCTALQDIALHYGRMRHIARCHEPNTALCAVAVSRRADASSPRGGGFTGDMARTISCLRHGWLADRTRPGGRLILGARIRTKIYNGVHRELQSLRLCVPFSTS